MGVRVRLTRNSSAYFPFWVAIPVMLVWYSIVLIVLSLYAIGWVLIVLPARGIAAWRESRPPPEPAPSGPRENSLTAAQPVWAPPQETPGQPQRQAEVAESHPEEQARADDETEDELRRARRRAQIADDYARREARISERAAERQAKAAGREAVYQAKSAARQQRKEAFRAARGPWRWPEWTLIGAVAAFVAFVVLAGVSGGNASNGAGTTAAWLLGVSILGGLVGVPTVAWRWYRARQAAAAMLAGAGQSQAGLEAPPPGPKA